MYERIKKYLIAEPRARERHAHQRGMVNLLLQDFPELKEVSKDKLISFCHSFESYCRIWRLVLSRESSLRGKDYGEIDGTKEIVEQTKMLEIGYTPGFFEDLKKLKTL